MTVSERHTSFQERKKERKKERRKERKKTHNASYSLQTKYHFGGGGDDYVLATQGSVPSYGLCGNVDCCATTVCTLEMLFE